MTIRKIVTIEGKTTLKKDESEELRIRGGKMKREFFHLNISVYFDLYLLIFIKKVLKCNFRVFDTKSEMIKLPTGSTLLVVRIQLSNDLDAERK